jgi:hypothetical protein
MLKEVYSQNPDRITSVVMTAKAASIQATRGRVCFRPG